MAWSFRPGTRASLRKYLIGYADPDNVVRSLESVVVAYDPGGVSKTIREMTQEHTTHVRRVERDTDRLLRTLAAVRGMAGLEIGRNYLEAMRPPSTPETTKEILRRLYESLIALRTAARKALPRRKRGRPPDKLRANLCEWVGFILAGEPASRARMVREKRGDVGTWRLDALRRVLPLLLEVMGATPHPRDYPPLLKRAQAGLTDRSDRAME